jgi:glycosyltransferase 2 family protein
MALERIPRRLLTAIQVTVSAGLLAYLLHHIPFDALLGAAAGASVPLVVAGMLGALILHWLDSIQMMWALARQQIVAGSLKVLKINLIAMFYSLFLPSMIAGGAIRWYHFARLDQRPAEALAAILFNRVFETLMLVAFGVGAFLVDRGSVGQESAGGPLILGLIVVAAIYFLMFDRRLHALMGSVLSALPLPARAKSAGDKLLAAMSRFDKLGAGFTLKYFSLGILRQVVAVGLIMVFVLALDIEVGVLTVAWIRSLVALLSLIPISIAGLGVREATFVVALGQYGVPAESALVLSLLLFARLVVYGLAGGLIEAHRVILAKDGAAELPR